MEGNYDKGSRYPGGILTKRIASAFPIFMAISSVPRNAEEFLDIHNPSLVSPSIHHTLCYWFYLVERISPCNGEMD